MKLASLSVSNKQPQLKICICFLSITLIVPVHSLSVNYRGYTFRRNALQVLDVFLILEILQNRRLDAEFGLETLIDHLLRDEQFLFRILSIGGDFGTEQQVEYQLQDYRQ